MEEHPESIQTFDNQKGVVYIHCCVTDIDSPSSPTDFPACLKEVSTEAKSYIQTRS